MLDSVRVRLALWHTAVLGVLLVSFAVAAYAFVARTSARRIDRDLEDTARAFAIALAAEREDTPSNATAVMEAAREFRFQNLITAVVDSAGNPLAINDESARRASVASEGDPAFDLVGVRARLRSSGAQSPILFTSGDREGGYRVYAAPTRVGGQEYVIIVAESLHRQAETLETARTAGLIVVPLVLLLAGLGGYALARRSLAPVVQMSVDAARISATNLDERLTVRNAKDELGQLAGVFNELLGRVETAFTQQRRFMADASHELRTPITIMRSEADVTLGKEERSPEEYRDSLGVIRDEGERLSIVVEELFLLARADAGQYPLRQAELYLDELVHDSVRAVRTLADERQISVSCDSAVEAPVRGDEVLLRGLLTNLLDNAIKYSEPGGHVEVSLRRCEASYILSLVDTGPGIPAEAQAQIFDRFFRVDGARARAERSQTGGAGLGLAIARWVAEAHGGRLELVHSSALGSEFRTTLPAPQPAPRSTGP
ncbi:MAG: ATP-binding protein [Gemmatimonadota bacterium]|nr:ATP-binding protein [Gemmatimonadota bacterium]